MGCCDGSNQRRPLSSTPMHLRLTALQRRCVARQAKAATGQRGTWGGEEIVGIEWAEYSQMQRRDANRGWEGFR